MTKTKQEFDTFCIDVAKALTTVDSNMWECSIFPDYVWNHTELRCGNLRVGLSERDTSGRGRIEMLGFIDVGLAKTPISETRNVHIKAITVNALKSAGTVAGDIMRRILPDLRELEKTLLERLEQERVEYAERLQFAEELKSTYANLTPQNDQLEKFGTYGFLVENFSNRARLTCDLSRTDVLKVLRYMKSEGIKVAQ